MAGLPTGQGKARLSTPWYDNVLVNAVGAPAPKPAIPSPGQSPVYRC
ncbi:hypothetical protein [Sphingomonas sp. MS122]